MGVRVLCLVSAATPSSVVACGAFLADLIVHKKSNGLLRSVISFAAFINSTFSKGILYRLVKRRAGPSSPWRKHQSLSVGCPIRQVHHSFLDEFSRKNGARRRDTRLAKSMGNHHHRTAINTGMQKLKLLKHTSSTRETPSNTTNNNELEYSSPGCVTQS